jgi:hypothetical protein
MPMDKKPAMKIKAKAKEMIMKPKAKSAAKPDVKVKAKVTVKVKPKGLNDFLDKGMTPPSKNKKLPSDADVILKGYNDKKTIAKFKESQKKKGKK